MIASGKPPKDDSWKRKYKEPPAPDTVDLRGAGSVVLDGIGSAFDCIVPNRMAESFSGDIPWLTLPDMGDSIEVASARGVV